MSPNPTAMSSKGEGLDPTISEDLAAGKAAQQERNLQALYKSGEGLSLRSDDWKGPDEGCEQNKFSGGNHALQDYQIQLMLLEQQSKKRMMMAHGERLEQERQEKAKAAATIDQLISTRKDPADEDEAGDPDHVNIETPSSSRSASDSTKSVKLGQEPKVNPNSSASATKKNHVPTFSGVLLLGGSSSDTDTPPSTSKVIISMENFGHIARLKRCFRFPFHAFKFYTELTAQMIASMNVIQLQHSKTFHLNST
jgi:hypothetical protein